MALYNSLSYHKVSYLWCSMICTHIMDFPSLQLNHKIIHCTTPSLIRRNKLIDREKCTTVRRRDTNSVVHLSLPIKLAHRWINDSGVLSGAFWGVQCEILMAHLWQKFERAWAAVHRRVVVLIIHLSQWKIIEGSDYSPVKKKHHRGFRLFTCQKETS